MTVQSLQNLQQAFPHFLLVHGKQQQAEQHAIGSLNGRRIAAMQGALKSLFPSLLELAGRLVQAGQAACQGAGSHLYTLLFAAPNPDKAAQYQQVQWQATQAFTCCEAAAYQAMPAESLGVTVRSPCNSWVS